MVHFADPMTLLTIGGITMLSLLIVFLVYILIVMDCDFTLYWCRLFGSPISRLRNRVVWISGASCGLGEAIAIQLAQVGAKLVITGNEDTHQDVKQRCIEASKGQLVPNDVLAIDPFDIRDVEKQDAIVQRVLDHFGQIDVLINNVGITQRANFESITHDFEKVIMDINYFGQVNLTKLVARHFRTRKQGHFAATISVCGKFAAPFSASYNASKFALMGYFDTIRAEMPFVDVTLVCPGPIFTQNIAKAHMAGDFEQSKRSYDPEDKRMTVERAAFLYCLSVANRLDEVWFSLKPILWIFYGIQFFPSTFRKLSPIIGTNEILQEYVEAVANEVINEQQNPLLSAITGPRAFFL